jgi:hypothetical protein
VVFAWQDKHFSAGVTAMKVAKRRVLLDTAQNFGGTHDLHPRELFVQIRYKFHH